MTELVVGPGRLFADAALQLAGEGPGPSAAHIRVRRRRAAAFGRIGSVRLLGRRSGGFRARFLDAAGRELRRADAVRIPLSRWKVGGEFGRALRDFHRLAPLEELWVWPDADGSPRTSFRLAEPVPAVSLAAASLLSPFARRFPVLAAAAGLRVAGVGLGGGGMELALRLPEALE